MTNPISLSSSPLRPCTFTHRELVQDDRGKGDLGEGLKHGTQLLIREGGRQAANVQLRGMACDGYRYGPLVSH